MARHQTGYELALPQRILLGLAGIGLLILLIIVDSVVTHPASTVKVTPGPTTVRVSPVPSPYTVTVSPVTTLPPIGLPGENSSSTRQPGNPGNSGNPGQSGRSGGSRPSAPAGGNTSTQVVQPTVTATVPGPTVTVSAPRPTPILPVGPILCTVTGLCL